MPTQTDYDSIQTWVLGQVPQGDAGAGAIKWHGEFGGVPNVPGRSGVQELY